MLPDGTVKAVVNAPSALLQTKLQNPTSNQIILCYNEMTTRELKETKSDQV